MKKEDCCSHFQIVVVDFSNKHYCVVAACLSCLIWSLLNMHRRPFQSSFQSSFEHAHKAPTQNASIKHKHTQTPFTFHSIWRIAVRILKSMFCCFLFDLCHIAQPLNTWFDAIELRKSYNRLCTTVKGSKVTIAWSRIAVQLTLFLHSCWRSICLCDCTFQQIFSVVLPWRRKKCPTGNDD